MESSEKIITFARFSSKVEALSIKDYLEENGIMVKITGDELGHVFGGSYDLVGFECDFERAHQLLVQAKIGDVVNKAEAPVEILEDLIQKAENWTGTPLSEETAKDSFINPLLRFLGYDLANTDDIIPDYPCGKQRALYAILQGGVPVLLIFYNDFSNHNTISGNDYSSCLQATPSVHFVVVTNGISYVTFSDRDQEGLLSDNPFLSFTLDFLTDNHVEKMLKFGKGELNVDDLLNFFPSLDFLEHNSLDAIGNLLESKNGDRFYGKRPYRIKPSWIWYTSLVFWLTGVVFVLLAIKDSFDIEELFPFIIAFFGIAILLTVVEYVERKRIAKKEKIKGGLMTDKGLKNDDYYIVYIDVDGNYYFAPKGIKHPIDQKLKKSARIIDFAVDFVLGIFGR